MSPSNERTFFGWSHRESREEKAGSMKQKGKSENPGVGSAQPNFAGFEYEWSHI